MESYQPIIGLEVHVELKTASKMFCSCSADYFGREPNTHVCPICLGLPGSLPVPNKKAIEWTLMVGLALNCRVSSFSKFDRKNYFYPDLPKGFQISQYDLPLTQNGKLKMSREAGSRSAGENGKLIRIRRVHLEEDTAKMIHATVEGERVTLIDFNRSGVPLLEVVTEPDISSAQQAKEFLEKLQQVVRYLGVSEADMEKGQMRCEPTVNLKIERDGKEFYTPLVEIKNINSFRFVQKAIDFEIERQLEELEKTGIEKKFGNKTTRGWSETLGKTVPQRVKEEAADYRYFPEPDIPPIRWRNEEIKKLRKLLPELPEEKIERFGKQYGLSKYNARILTETKERADYFEEALRQAQGKLESTAIANWIINKRVDITKVSPSALIQMILAKTQAFTLKETELRRVIEKVVKINRKAVDDFKKGKSEALEFLVGHVFRESGGKAEPNQTRKLLLKALNAIRS